MRQALIIAITLGTLSISGCKSKQAQLTTLNAQFDTLNDQYQKDCILAPITVIQQSQAKCKAEGDTMRPLGAKILQLQAEIAASSR